MSSCFKTPTQRDTLPGLGHHASPHARCRPRRSDRRGNQKSIASKVAARDKITAKCVGLGRVAGYKPFHTFLTWGNIAGLGPLLDQHRETYSLRAKNFATGPNRAHQRRETRFEEQQNLLETVAPPRTRSGKSAIKRQEATSVNGSGLSNSQQRLNHRQQIDEVAIGSRLSNSLPKRANPHRRMFRSE